MKHDHANNSRSFFGTHAFVSVTLCAGLMCTAGCLPVGQRSARSTGGGGAYFTGIYPDLFGALLGKSPAVVKARIDSTFHQLFYGDEQAERVYYSVGPDMAYIEDIGNADVRTEGMSYGMMIAVQMGRREEFNRLWKWAKTYMQCADGPHKGYFAWHCRTDGTVLDSAAASDGEEWFVTSLFFASARWGEGEGIFAYRTEAQSILHTMLHKESEPGHGSVTNMFNATEKLVAFVPSFRANFFTDPSYQVPHFYELWGRWAAADNPFWCDVAQASRRLLQKAADTVTGLTPDYAGFDGKPISMWGGGHGDFRFDAWRVAMNVAIDWVWFQPDAWHVTESNRLLKFFHARGVSSHGNQYTLDGRKLGEDHSAGLVAMNAVAALASTSDSRGAFVEELWRTPVPKGLYRYYDGTLYMLALLQVSGNFRIYDPTGTSVKGCPE
jgi:oligosaccharide reducing-end xylanase